MNGEINPNANRMAGFGKGKNHMQSNKDASVNMADILPKDPYADDNSKRSKWMKESAQKHEQKQAEIAAEQAKFVPESFKKSGAMNLDIKGNKSQGAQKSWLDNNSKMDASGQPQQQQQPSSSQPQNQNGFPHGNNRQNANNQQPPSNNNFPFNNNMNQNQNGNQMQNRPPNQSQKQNERPPQQQQQQQQNNNFPHNANMNQNRGNNMNKGNNMPNKNANQNKPAPQQMNRNMNNNNNNKNNDNNNMQGNPQQNNNQNQNMNAALNRPQGPVEQPIPQPYYQKKEDPFAQFANNAQYQRDLKNHGGGNKGGYSQMKQPNARPYNHNAQNSGNLNGQPVENASLYHTGNKESKNWSGVDNQFSQPIRSTCTACGKAVQESWTEDSKKRMYHNECFVCSACGTQLGSIGKYVTVANGVMCKPCRSQQMRQQHPNQY